MKSITPDPIQSGAACRRCADERLLTVVLVAPEGPSGAPPALRSRLVEGTEPMLLVYVPARLLPRMVSGMCREGLDLAGLSAGGGNIAAQRCCIMDTLGRLCRVG